MCGVFGYGGFEVPKYNTFIEDKNGERIDLILDVAKRSRLNMGMRDGILTVRVPYGCSKQQLESFINNNLGWIKEQKDKATVGLPKDFCHGERLRLLGNELTLTLVQADKYFSPKIEGRQASHCREQDQRPDLCKRADHQVHKRSHSGGDNKKYAENVCLHRACA